VLAQWVFWVFPPFQDDSLALVVSPPPLCVFGGSSVRTKTSQWDGSKSRVIPLERDANAEKIKNKSADRAGQIFTSTVGNLIYKYILSIN